MDQISSLGIPKRGWRRSYICLRDSGDSPECQSIVVKVNMDGRQGLIVVVHRHIVAMHSRVYHPCVSGAPSFIYHSNHVKMSVQDVLKARLDWFADLLKTGVHSARNRRKTLRQLSAEGKVLAKIVDRPINFILVIYNCEVKVEAAKSLRCSN
jgi:hypothetical protein